MSKKPNTGFVLAVPDDADDLAEAERTIINARRQLEGRKAIKRPGPTLKERVAIAAERARARQAWRQADAERQKISASLAAVKVVLAQLEADARNLEPKSNDEKGWRDLADKAGAVHAARQALLERQQRLMNAFQGAAMTCGDLWPATGWEAERNAAAEAASKRGEAEALVAEAADIEARIKKGAQEVAEVAV